MRKPEFTAKYRELTAGDSQYKQAEKLEITQAYASQLHRGIAIPGPAIIDRLAERYGGSRDELLILAGHKTADLSGAERLVRGLMMLQEKYQRPIPVWFGGGNTALTAEEAEVVLAEIERQLASEATTR